MESLMMQLCDRETVLTEKQQQKANPPKKDQYNQCDDKNSSRF